MPQSPDQDLNWETPSGRLLERFARGLPRDRPVVLNVFGSSPLQLKLDPSFLSGDVDVFSDEDFRETVKSMHLGKGQSDPYIEIVSPSVFIASPVWRDRADKKIIGNVTLYIASALDVLVGKVKRLDPKDFDAFDLVKAKTGGPSEEVFKRALQDVVDMYRPAFDEENPGGDAIANTRRLWKYLYGHDIDVRREIISPAISERKEAYGYSAPASVQKLRDLSVES